MQLFEIVGQKMGLRTAENWVFTKSSLDFLEHKNSWTIGESSGNVKKQKGGFIWIFLIAENS